MTIRAAKFTPEVLLSAPRRSAGVPNSTGRLALYTVSTYSFEKHTRTSQIRALDIESGQSNLLFENSAYSEPVWVSENEIVFLKSGDDETKIFASDASKSGSEPYEIRTISGSISNIKVKPLDDGTVAFAAVAVTTPQGTFYRAKDEKKTYTTGKIYSKLFVRHWDSYTTENKNAIWYGSLKRDGGGKFELQEPGLVNALVDTKLESPSPPFGGSGDYDISSSGLVFTAADPALNPAIWTKSDLYFVPLKSFTEKDPPKPQIVKTGKLQGYSGSPVFSPDGKKLVFKRMLNKQYESDKWHLLLIPDVSDLSNVQEFYATEDGVGSWDQRPSGLTWSNDGGELYVTAEYHARTLLYKLPSTPLKAKELPYALTVDGSVDSVYTLSEADGRLFVSSSSLTDSSYYTIVDPSSPSGNGTLVNSVTKSGKTLGLSRSQVSEIWSQGAGDYKVHSLVITPPGFDRDSGEKLPLAFIIHGGPQGANADGWSTRWNPALWASQGYAVVTPNPTGSTGYGQNFTDAIASNWGGRPYVDLERTFEAVKEQLPFVDTERAIAAGASYGGYMINWIQGHPLGRKFKALFCHDGVFSTSANWSTEELFFVIHDFGGTPWGNREGYAEWDPSAHTDQWSTPQIIVHNELDYRLPVSEGLAAFNVLQYRGVPSKFVTFPDENHWVLKPENSLVWHREVFGFLNSYVGLDTSDLVETTQTLTLEK